MKRFFPGILSAVAMLLLRPAPLQSQTSLDNSIICAGTTRTVSGSSYCWLSLQPADITLTASRNIAIYRKTGTASSANTFARLTVLAPTTDPRLCQSLLPQAALMGEDLATLDGMLTDLVGTAPGTATTGEKLAALISDSLPDVSRQRQLMMLARTHPAVAMAAGVGYVDRVPAAAAYTYEFREFDTASSTDRGVLGRSTLNPAAPVVLPAPGAPVEVPDLTAKANLNIALRWSTPDTLRDLAPLTMGYNLYRVPKVRAETLGWHTTPPTAAALAGETLTKRVNTSAIVTGKLFTTVDVGNFTTDASTTYFLDDNGRFQDGGTPFTDGQQFYYFATARDLLGQPGTPSAGALMRICDRLPPPVPVQLSVNAITHYDAGAKLDKQRLELSWKMPTLPAGESISAFLIYRWRSASQPVSARHIDPAQARPDENLIAVLPATQLTFTDDGTPPPPAWSDWGGGTDNGLLQNPPTLPADAGKTWFYTVRAVDGSVCRNVSGNSSPIWGVLRDRSGPAGVQGMVLVPCRNVQLVWNDYTQVDEAGLADSPGHLRLVCNTAVPAGLAWAEWQGITQLPGNQALYTPLGRAYFSKNNAGNLRAELDRDSAGYTGNASFRCRVGTTDGIVSGWVVSPGDSPSPVADKRLRCKWTASFSPSALVPAGQCGYRHTVVDDTTGALLDPCGTFTPSAGTTEWKVYRTVNAGPQTLVDAGAVTAPGDITWKDEAPPVTLSALCYYLQLFDKNGNASPLVLQDCLESGSGILLPIPMLEDITSAGLPGSSQMRVRWFCSTAGVERFEVWVARKSGTSPTNGTGLSTDLATHPNMLTDVSGTEGLDFTVFETAPARQVSPDGTPEFEYVLPCSAKDVYTVIVRAVGKGAFDGRVTGTFSNVESFSWTLHTLALGNAVPWPARGLPQQADFHSGISAIHLNLPQFNPWRGNAVRIGEYKDPSTGAQSTTFMLNDNQPTEPRAGRISIVQDPLTYLYCNDEVGRAESAWEGKLGNAGCLFPVVLYRVQVPSLLFPVVPGDIVQCGPLMEQIAWTEDAGQTITLDPFVLPLHMNDTGLPRTILGTDHDLVLLDRQPVIKGAKYKYLLVRLGPNKEIERVIVTNEIFVP